jgi:hypothetical protein
MASGRGKLAALAVVAALGLGGCEGVDTTTRDRTLTGAAVGAAGGAAVGLLTGSPLSKAVTGAVGGAAGGFVYDQIKKAQ